MFISPPDKGFPLISSDPSFPLTRGARGLGFRGLKIKNLLRAPNLRESYSNQNAYSFACRNMKRRRTGFSLAVQGESFHITFPRK